METQFEDAASPSPSYYSILGLRPESSLEEIKRAYRKLAMRWHPDKWAATSSALLGESKRRFQQIQEAYSVLSDRRKRTLYDAGLYDKEDDEPDEGLCDFVEEMLDLMAQHKEEDKNYTMEELQKMLADMAQEFETTCGWALGDDGRNRYRDGNQSKRARRDGVMMVVGSAGGLGSHGSTAATFCN
ncbi:unnamed protein product [Linum trigynum]|uniref:J domain-containing protein n=1 Tax=Linum trigynum TaxID=586398 RepID=A0AAV2EZH4_9ROSI